MTHMPRPIPFKLVETWFWMAFSCKQDNVNKAGKSKIEKNFGSIDSAIQEFPALQQYEEVEAWTQSYYEYKC